jgi:hypothetical protein
MAKRAAKKTVKKKEVKTAPVKIKVSKTKFRIYCLENGITQNDIRDKTDLSIGCIHGAWNSGTSTPSTINKIATAFDIDKDILSKMIKEKVKGNK